MELGHRSFREVIELIERSHDPDTHPQPTLAEELAAIPYEPLLPAEKWLISVSLILGVILLAVLSWASATFYPAKPAATDARSKAVSAHRTTTPTLLRSCERAEPLMASLRIAR
jgi:hypothetical protein